MKLRVITATRGSSLHLIATVRSVEALELFAHHILVCPVREQLKLELQFPRCRVVVQQGEGLYAALNTGMGAGQPDDFFTWLNDDDCLKPEEFRRALAQLAGNPSLDAVYGRVSLVDGLTSSLGELPVARRPDDLPALLASGIMPLAQPGTVFRWRVADQVGPFDPSYQLAGDLDFFVRAVRAGLRFGFHDGDVAWFRLHAGQLSKQEAAAASEHARAIAALPRIPAGAARRRFRWDNRWVYWQRIRQHGFVRMNTLYRRG